MQEMEMEDNKVLEDRLTQLEQSIGTIIGLFVGISREFYNAFPEDMKIPEKETLSVEERMTYLENMTQVILCVISVISRIFERNFVSMEELLNEIGEEDVIH